MPVFNRARRLSPATRLLQIAEHLRPDGDHADEQRERRQRGGFLQNGLYGFEHGPLPEQKENIVHGMF